MNEYPSEGWWQENKPRTTWDEVKKDIDVRERMGYNKYNKWLTHMTDEDMLQHLYEELLDATVYIKTLIIQREQEKKVNREIDFSTGDYL